MAARRGRTRDARGLALCLVPVAAARLLGLRATLLRVEAALLRRAGRLRRAALPRRRRGRFGQEGRQTVARGPAVGELGAVLGRRNCDRRRRRAAPPAGSASGPASSRGAMASGRRRRTAPPASRRCSPPGHPGPRSVRSVRTARARVRRPPGRSAALPSESIEDRQGLPPGVGRRVDHHEVVALHLGQVACAPAAVAARDVGVRLAIGTTSSSTPWTQCTGTSSGICRSGSTGSSSGPGGWPRNASTAPPPRRSSYADRQVEHAGLGDDPGEVDPCRPPVVAAARGRPGREVPAGGVAHGDARGRAGRSWSARASIAAATSSRVCGSPPPLPTRRYSMFHAAQPCSARLAASGRPSDEVVRRLPEAAVDDHDDALRCVLPGG